MSGAALTVTHASVVRAAEKDAWLREQRGKQKAEAQVRAKEEREAREEQRRQAELMSYKASNSGVAWAGGSHRRPCG